MEEEKIEAAREALLSTEEEGGPKKNNYALGCGVLASMTAILMGYRNKATLSLIYLPFQSLIIYPQQ